MNKQIFKLMFLSFLLVQNFTSIFGQERMVDGVVTTFDSLYVSNASVVVKSSGQEVFTDSLGAFQILCDGTEKLKVSAMGFYNQNVKINPKIKYVMVNLKLKPGEVNQKHAIGYGHITDTDKLNAIVSLNESDIDFSQYSDMYDLMMGRFPGVRIQNGEIIIRGTSSFEGSSSALIIVNDIEVDIAMFENISPSSVKSINVLKDSSASAYGSRGANGVVIIELKGKLD